MAKGQKLKLEAYARLGKGKNHAKWQPVCVCAYKYFPKIKVPAESCGGCQKCVDICPKNVFEVKEDEIGIRDLLACNLCMDCVEACPEEPKRIKVEWEKNDFIMNIESTGALPPETILRHATKILDKELLEFEEQLKVEEA